MPLQTDGGTLAITVTGGADLLAGITRCILRGSLPDASGAPAPAEFPLVADAPGRYRSPQLPPGSWRIILTGPQPRDVPVEVKTATETPVAIAL